MRGLLCSTLFAYSGCDGGARVPPRNAGVRLDAGVKSDTGKDVDAALDGSRPVDAGRRAPGAAKDASLGRDGSEPSPVDGDARTPDAGDAAGPVASLFPSFGPGFTELIAPIESTIPLVVPLVNSVSGGTATLGVIRDLDGDGAPEVVLSVPWHDTPSVLAYDAGGGALVVRGNLSSIDLLAIADLDDDGRVDLLSRMPFGIAWGQGGGVFAPVQGISSPSLPNNLLFDDVDRDGWLDIVADAPTTSSARDLSILLRTGLRSFADHSSMIPPATRTCPYALLGGDLRPREKLLMVFGVPCSSNLHSSSGIYRESGLDAAGYPTFEAFDPIPAGLPIMRINTEGGLTSRAPMGGAMGDLDDDGFDDLSIAVDPLTTLFAGPGFPLEDRTHESGFAEVPGSAPGTLSLPWGVAFVDVDQDGRKDVIAAHGNDPSAWLDPTHRIGPQKTTIHWNADGRHFLDTTDALGVGRLGQWKALSVGDLDGDGDPDLVVGGQSELPRVYRNDVSSGNHGFALRLHGTSSNHLGLGARVDVTISDGSPVAHYVAGGTGSPYVVSEPLVFVGLGRAEGAKRVRITWPSGTVQELSDVSAGSVHGVEEPVLFTVAPETRHQPADGSSELVVVISPRDPTGSVLAGATITAQLRGAGTLVGPTPKGDGTFEARIVAPVTAGSSVLEISVDGIASGVRPRLFWD